MSYPPVKNYGNAGGGDADPRRDSGISMCLAPDPTLASTFCRDKGERLLRI